VTYIIVSQEVNRGRNVIKSYYTVCGVATGLTAKVVRFYIAVHHDRSIEPMKFPWNPDVEFSVTFTRPDWRWPIFDGERVAAFSTTAVGAAASENFLVASDKKFEPRSDESKGRGRNSLWNLIPAVIANLHKRRKRKRGVVYQPFTFNDSCDRSRRRIVRCISKRYAGANDIATFITYYYVLPTVTVNYSG